MPLSVAVLLSRPFILSVSSSLKMLSEVVVVPYAIFLRTVTGQRTKHGDKGMKPSAGCDTGRDGNIQRIRVLFFLAVFVNVSLIISIEIMMADRRDRTSRTRQCDLTLTQGRNLEYGEHLSSYCFKQGKDSCVDRGYTYSSVVGEEKCCGHLGNHIYEKLSEVSRDRL